MNRLSTSNEIETVILKLSKNKIPGPVSFTVKSYQIIREELTFILLKLFQKNCRRKNTPNSFYDATITLMAKSHNDISKKRKRKKEKKIMG